MVLQPIQRGYPLNISRKLFHLLYRYNSLDVKQIKKKNTHTHTHLVSLPHPHHPMFPVHLYLEFGMFKY